MGAPLMACTLVLSFSQHRAAANESPVPERCYLFSHFVGNGEDGLHLAWSRDGLKWEALNGGKSYLTPTVGKAKLMRDPCLIQGPDGTFHMVWTDSWDSRTIGYASSKDLLRWSTQRAIPVMRDEPEAQNCWAPEIAYDNDRGCFLIFWASTIPSRFPATWLDGQNDGNHRIYATTTKDFETFTPTRLFFDPGFNCIDSTLFARSNKVYMVFKDETKVPAAMKNLRLAVADTWAGPYRVKPEPINAPGAWVEGPTVLQIGDEVYLYFDAYTRHQYAALRSRDLEDWEDISERISFPGGIRHGTALEVSGAVVRRLIETADDPEARIQVETDAEGIAVSPIMHGVFFEDINYGADGGLYAELVQNRSFENRDSLYSWEVVNPEANAKASVESLEPLNTNNPHFLRLDIRAAGEDFGVANDGFEGIPLNQDEVYLFSVQTRSDHGFRGALRVVLEDEQGREIGTGRIEGVGGNNWQPFETTLTSAETVTNARLVIIADGQGRLDLDMISLFPKHTYKNRRNGLRADLVQMLADMEPGFLRFPGGCVVEGKDLANAYRWKDTVGDIAERRQNWNRWQDAVATMAPHYYQTYGLGFFEYFQLCEDIGAEPVPILNCGMSCQYQDGQTVPLGELDPWVQDALDLVDFANGPADSAWGSVRARMGHPEPFHLKYLGIGNEQWDETYFQRYQVFYDALKAKCPEIHLITTSGPGVDDHWWNLAWRKFEQGTPAEIVDEHYYRSPQWFLDNTTRYAGYDRDGPKVFAGEFAAHDSGRENNLRCALAEAAFMTGLLRNADVVVMASYAPLFAKEGFTQWRPDLIWFDNTRVYGSPSYYVQALFSRNRPDIVLPVHLQQPAATLVTGTGRIGVGTWNTQAEFKEIRVTRNGKTLFETDSDTPLDAWTTSGGHWELSEGTLRQMRIESDVSAVTGDTAWQNYNYSLKARKLGGDEGFLILFQIPGGGAWGGWNWGGWGNTAHALEGPGLPTTRIPGRIETNRWYDVRIELNGPSVNCYLDRELVQEATRLLEPRLYSVAGRDSGTGEIILWVVNPSSRAIPATIELHGLAAVGPQATATLLTSESPTDRNSFAQPDRVVPREESLALDGPDFHRTFAAYSATLLRIQGTE